MIICKDIFSALEIMIVLWVLFSECSSSGWRSGSM